MTQHQATAGGQKSSDAVLWVAALAVAGVGAGWLLLSEPWEGDTAPPQLLPVQTPRPALPAPAEPATAGSADVEGWLRMARLALDSGMLVEPEGSNAWSLYARVRAQEPANDQALAGLDAVADALIERGNVALEQGRFDDVAGIIELIGAELPGHAGASALQSELAAARRQAEEAAARAAALKAELQAASSAAPTAAVPVVVDPMTELGAAFERAMSANRLLTPEGDNARELVEQMVATAPEHSLTQAARSRLFAALLERGVQAAEALDTRAAGTWFDQAASLNVDAEAVERERTALIDRLVAAEAARPVPATELVLVHYVPPQYPERAVIRELEGWVDVEFTVGADGKTRDVTVAQASDELFHNAATQAVAQWQFEPRLYMDRVIEQRASTRIRFALQ